jgi:2-oxoglutarate dehydrogenase E2 component (dihydrolipoamide succinyltransferase)
MDIKVPPVGESVFEALIARWLKKTGDHVAKDEALCEIETDKVTLEVTAEVEGILTILVPEVETVKIGTVIATIDETAAEAGAGEARKEPEPRPPVQEPPAPKEPPVKEPPAKEPPVKEPPGKEQPVQEPPVREPPPAAQAPPAAAAQGATPPMSPSGRKLARELGVEAHELKGSGRGGRVTIEDLRREQEEQGMRQAPAAEPAVAASAPSDLRAAAQPAPEATFAGAGVPRPQAAQPRTQEAGERVTRKRMPPIRKRIAERLVAARQQTAMLTTFNEADMTQVIALRKKHGEFFQRRHQVKLGFMSLFVRACCQALREFPDVNASIEGDDIVYHNFCDIGVAIGGEKGLVVPVLRGAESMSLAEIEKRIADFGEKIRTNRLAIADLEGGTFTVSNGGIYGSLLSTPILNTPQSGVLGMHAIQERPVVRNGEIVIRPMMYLALSYDHRIVDGKGAVGFLKLVKEYIEEPEEMLLEG